MKKLRREEFRKIFKIKFFNKLMRKISEERWEELKIPGKDIEGHQYPTHEAELKAVLKSIKTIDEHNEYTLFRKYRKAGNISLEQAAFETKDRPNRRRLLLQAKKYYEKAQSFLEWSKNPKEFSDLGNAIISIEETLRKPFKSPNPAYYVRRVSGFLIFAFLISSLFFFSMNFTGAVVGTAKHDFNFLGILFFVCSLVCAFLYFRKKFF